MTRAEMLAELKEVLRESTVDAAWGDTRLLAYLEEGQDKFCEDTGYFVDASNFTIDTADGTASYAVPDRVIEVLDVFDSNNRRLGRIQERDRSYPAHDSMPSVFGTSGTGQSPSYYQLDRETESILFIPTPSQVETLTLKVWRYSQNALASGSNEPEIPSRFQRACIEWAAYKALMHHDAEQQDPVKAGEHLQAYRLYVRDGKVARRRMMGQRQEIIGHPLYVVR